ncbi:hypothetical protein MCOR31_007013 [Pyricularia oryzae]|nr:hypothetical protein MCOR31_007013 [Pyricularia oryzae]
MQCTLGLCDPAFLLGSSMHWLGHAAGVWGITWADPSRFWPRYSRYTVSSVSRCFQGSRTLFPVVINTYALQQHASSVKVTGTRAAIPGTVGINKLVVSKVYNGMELRGQGNAMSSSFPNPPPSSSGVLFPSSPHHITSVVKDLALSTKPHDTFNHSRHSYLITNYVLRPFNHPSPTIVSSSKHKGTSPSQDPSTSKEASCEPSIVGFHNPVICSIELETHSTLPNSSIPIMTRSHKANNRNHAALANGTALPEEHIPKYFAKHGFLDNEPKKVKKNGGGRSNWGNAGEEVLDENFTFAHARRRSNSSSYTSGQYDFKTKFDVNEPEPVFEESMGAEFDEEETLAKTDTSSSNGSVNGEDKMAKSL